MITAFESSVTSHQKAWIEEALSLTTYPIDASALDITYVASSDLPAAHAYMYTEGTTGAPNFTTLIQPWSDESSTGPGNPGSLTGEELRKFFRESVIHELMHAAQFYYAWTDAQKAELASCFVKVGATGEAGAVGTLGDYKPTGAAWADQIVEAIAEAGKDLWLPEQFRQYDNRTNWQLQRADL